MTQPDIDRAQWALSEAVAAARGPLVALAREDAENALAALRAVTAPKSAPWTGKRLANLRARLDLTRNQFARLLRLAPASGFKTVKRWEMGDDISGPVQIACEAMEAGFLPHDQRDARASAAEPD